MAPTKRAPYLYSNSFLVEHWWTLFQRKVSPKECGVYAEPRAYVRNAIIHDYLHRFCGALFYGPLDLKSHMTNGNSHSCLCGMRAFVCISTCAALA